MDWLRQLWFVNGNFLGIEWNLWKAIGMTGNALFFSRFLVQWYATEKRRQVVIPQAFWWLSLAGSALLFAYAAFYRRDSVFIVAYALTWIPYVRNLVIHHRTRRHQHACPSCGHLPLALDRFCSACGQPLNHTRPQPAARTGLLGH
jgi:lipid-A-disaccharide synthase-like uncharacterized protein